MHTKTKKSLLRLAKKRFNTLYSSKRKSTRAIVPKRYRVDSRVKIQPRFGYTFLSTESPVFTYDYMDFIQKATTVLGPHITPGMKIQKNDFSFFEIERQILNALHEDGSLESFIRDIKFDRGFRETIDFRSYGLVAPDGFDEKQKSALLVYNYKLSSTGYLFMKSAFENNDEWLILGMAMLKDLIGVCTWYEMCLDDQIDSFMDYSVIVCHNEEDDETNPEDFEERTGDWRDYPEAEVCFMHCNYSTMKVSAYLESEKELAAAEESSRERFIQVLRDLNYESLKLRMYQNDHLALWLRSIVWLVINDTHFSDYCYQDDESTPTWQSYGIGWDPADAHIQVTDEIMNGEYQGYGLGSFAIPFICTADRIWKPEGENHFEKVSILHKVFQFETKEKLFYDEQQNSRILADLRSLSLSQWEQLLRGAIERWLSRITDRMETAG